MTRTARLLWKLILFIGALLAAWLIPTKTAWAREGARAEAKEFSEGKGKKTHPAPEDFDRLLYRDLATEVGERWLSLHVGAAGAPSCDVEAMKARLYDVVMGASGLASGSEDPRRRMEALSRELFVRRGFRISAPGGSGFQPEEILIHEVLLRRKGSPLAVATIYLAALELSTPPLEVRALVFPRGAAVRFQDGGIVANALMVPGEEGKIVKGEFQREIAAEGEERSGIPQIRTLGKAELAGALLRELSRAARRRDEEGECRSLLGSSLALDPKMVDAWIELAELEGIAGDREREKEAVENALALSPDDTKALARRSRILRDSGDLEAAEKDLRRALEKDRGGNPDLLLDLGDLEREMGRYPEALQAYRKFLAGDPPRPARERIAHLVNEIELQPSIEVLGGDGGYPTRFEALRRVASVRTDGSIEALIAALRDENQRFARLAWQSLREMTGLEIGFDAEAWDRWWAKERSQAAKPERPASEKERL